MKPYNKEQPKSVQVREMFDRIAPHYDMLNHLLSMGVDRGWRRRLVRMVRRDFAQPQATPANHASLYTLKHCERVLRILDLATGTGDMAIALARKVECSQITAADPSQGMLAIAQGKIAEKGLQERIVLEVASAESLPFPDGHFDAVTVVFGVRNFYDIDKSLGEMLRVLCPGGRLYIMEFSKPDNKIFGRLYRFYFHRVLPVIGGLISKDRKAYRYLPGSVDEFPSAETFRGMLTEAGFVRSRSTRLFNGVACIYTAEKI